MAYQYHWSGSGRRSENSKSFAAIRRDRKLAGMEPHAELYRVNDDNETEILVRDGGKEFWTHIDNSGAFPHV